VEQLNLAIPHIERQEQRCRDHRNQKKSRMIFRESESGQRGVQSHDPALDRYRDRVERRDALLIDLKQRP